MQLMNKQFYKLSIFLNYQFLIIQVQNHLLLVHAYCFEYSFLPPLPAPKKKDLLRFISMITFTHAYLQESQKETEKN